MNQPEYSQHNLLCTGAGAQAFQLGLQAYRQIVPHNTVEVEVDKLLGTFATMIERRRNDKKQGGGLEYRDLLQEKMDMSGELRGPEKPLSKVGSEQEVSEVETVVVDNLPEPYLVQPRDDDKVYV